MANLAQFLLGGSAQAVEYQPTVNLLDADFPYTITPGSGQYVCVFIEIRGAGNSEEFSIMSEGNDIVQGDASAIGNIFGTNGLNYFGAAYAVPLIFGKGEDVTIDLTAGSITEMNVNVILLED